MLVQAIGVTGGAERFARELSLALDRDRFEVIHCVSRWPLEDPDDPAVAAALAELHESGIEFLPLNRRRTAEVWEWRPLLSTLRALPVDVLHAHMFGSNVWASVLGALAGTSVVIAHEHSWSYEGQSVRRFLDRHLIARRANAFVAVSNEDRRRMIEVERIPPDKIEMIPTGIPVPPRSSPAGLRKELGLGLADPVIGTVCGLRPVKALDVLLRSVASLRPNFPNLKVVIAGEGPDRSRLEQLTTELRLAEVVYFLGRRTDVPNVLDALDVAVMSSDSEGTPLAAIEFMAAGKAIVATRVGGLPDLIQDGVHGLLVEPQDPESLAQAVATLLVDRELADNLAVRARERQRAEYDIGVAAARFGALYERLYSESVGVTR